MIQKTISLPEPVYEKLLKQKQKNETLSDVITRLLHEDKEKNTPDISKYYGKFEEDEEGEWDRIEKELYADRWRPSLREKYKLSD